MMMRQLILNFYALVKDKKKKRKNLSYFLA